MKILVIDDEKLIVKGLKFNLENEGYEVVTGNDGMEAVELAKTGNFDLILLDVMMPRLNGLDACMMIREFSKVPIIMLTAKSEDIDKIMGFEYGADDYITKPFNIVEVKARIKAMLRRTSAAPESNSITFGDISIDSDRHTVTKSGSNVNLTATEFNLLELFAKNPGRVYSRENLLNIIWGYSYQGDIRTVDVHIRRIREKLEDNPAQPQFIKTKWGAGYYFEG